MSAQGATRPGWRPGWRPRAGPKELRRCPPGVAPVEPTRFRLEPLGVTLGAVVHGLGLADPLDDATVAELAAALDEWKVLVWRDQHLTTAQHVAAAARFGRLTDDQLAPSPKERLEEYLVVFTRDATTAGLENAWHSDGTFRPEPTAGTMLRAVEVPPAGGDTLFADMACAYDNLPGGLAERVAGMRAVHDWSLGAYADKYGDRLAQLRAEVPPVEHPAVIAHPRTGRPTLFVNGLFTERLVDPDGEADEALLAELCRQAEIPEYQLRLRWEPGTVALWDNVAVQHYGVNDYYPARRVMARATFFADPPLRIEPAAG